jgi:hypothetical protein
LPEPGSLKLNSCSGDQVTAAAAHAVLGETDEALAYLKRAVDAGWRFYRVAANDPLLERIREADGFKALIEELKADVSRMRGRVQDV